MLQTGRTVCGFGRVGTERCFSTERNKGASETVPQQANALCRQTRGSRARVSRCDNRVAAPHAAPVALRVRGRVRTPGSRSFLLLLRWLRRVAADLDVRNTRPPVVGPPRITPTLSRPVIHRRPCGARSIDLERSAAFPASPTRHATQDGSSANERAVQADTWESRSRV